MIPTWQAASSPATSELQREPMSMSAADIQGFTDWITRGSQSFSAFAIALLCSPDQLKKILILRPQMHSSASYAGSSLERLTRVSQLGSSRAALREWRLSCQRRFHEDHRNELGRFRTEMAVLTRSIARDLTIERFHSLSQTATRTKSSRDSRLARPARMKKE